MARLVHGGLAQVIAGDGAAGHRVRLDVAPVHDEGGRLGRAGRGHGRGQRTPAEDVAGQVGLEVDVQGRVGTFTQGLLHLGVVVGLADGPSVVDRPGRVREVEVDVVRGIGVVELGDLCLGHLFRHLAVLGRGRDDVEVRRDADRLLAARGKDRCRPFTCSRRPRRLVRV